MAVFFGIVAGLSGNSDNQSRGSSATDYQRAFAQIASGRNLGISRTQAQAALSSLQIRMEESSEVDGQPRMMGESSDGLCALEFIGPANDLKAVTMLAGSEGKRDSILLAAGRLTIFVRAFAPWAEQWVKQSLGNLESGQTVEMRQGNTQVIVSSFSIADGLMTTLTVKFL